jgi:hypothetical protein
MYATVTCLPSSIFAKGKEGATGKRTMSKDAKTLTIETKLTGADGC